MPECKVYAWLIEQQYNNRYINIMGRWSSTKSHKLHPSWNRTPVDRLISALKTTLC
jgi:hypothetical protein